MNIGFKSQQQLGTLKVYDEIRVAITGDDDFVFLDGRHRLSIAQALDIKKIPVIVIFKHKMFNGNIASLDNE
jgi:hypothetical protein